MSLKLLIADDEYFIRQRIKKIIPWEKLNLIFAGEAENGQQVIDHLEKEPVDLLLLDIKMPQMNGIETARYIKEHRINGRIHYGYCYGKTYHEARDKVNQARYALMNDQLLPVRGKRNRFADYCNEWLYLKRSSVKPSTFVKYTTILEKYIKPDLGQYFSEAISEILVEQFSYRLIHERGLSPKTVRDILSVLHSILNYTTKQNPLAKPVDIVYPRQDRKEMRVLTCEEQKRFTEYLLQDMDPCKFGVLLALLTGLRIGEVCALKWEDISLENKVIFVRHTMQRLKNLNPASEERTRIITGVPKSGRSVRIIPMNQDIEKLCNKWRADDPEAYVLTGKAGYFLEPRTLQYRMRQYTKDCDLKNVHFHTLRHSFATRCVEAGFEIRSLSEILGHSSTRITLECYVHSSMNLKRKNMEKLKIADTVEKEFPGA